MGYYFMFIIFVKGVLHNNFNESQQETALIDKVSAYAIKVNIVPTKI